MTAIPLRPRLLGACSNLPGRRWIRTWIPGHRLARKSPSRTVPIRSCSRWGLPCRLRCRRRGALLPHLFTLAAPAPAIPGKGMTGWSGGPFSVALSLGLHPPDVIRHRMSMEPGLSSRADLSATERPSGRLIEESMGKGSGEVKARHPLQLAWRDANRASRSAISPRNVAVVEASSTPSTRMGRKCRWNAATASRVVPSI